MMERKDFLMFRQKLIMIAAVSPEGILAIDGEMPWYQPEDLKRFKKLTTYEVLIYGRKTFDSFKRKPLKGRKNYIVSSSLSPTRALYENNLVSIYSNIDTAISDARLLYSNSKNIYIGGGATIYEQTLPIVDTIELTIINKDQVCYHEGERTMFPNWKGFEKDFEIEKISRSSTCQYVTYQRKPLSAINKIRSLFL